MFEVIIAAVIIAALLAAALIPPMTLLWAGAIVGTLGALVGVPAGFVYHARLWRALHAEDLDTEGMWLRPHHLHRKLSDARREPIVVLFAIGAAGFGLTILGAVAVVAAIVRLAAV
ncbi:MAG: hypothetical protein KC668_30455 [Myxococcales bacterium]|nr:hypothetical protein [Myxococcales bacterium]